MISVNISSGDEDRWRLFEESKNLIVSNGDDDLRRKRKKRKLKVACRNCGFEGMLKVGVRAKCPKCGHKLEVVGI